MKQGEDVNKQNIQRHSDAYHYQTIWNLYNSGVPTYIIGFQLDMDEKEVQKVIHSTPNNNRYLASSPLHIPLIENKSMGDVVTQPLDDIVNTDMAVKNAQIRMWKALRSEPEIT